MGEIRKTGSEDEIYGPSERSYPVYRDSKGQTVIPTQDYVLDAVARILDQQKTATGERSR